VTKADVIRPFVEKTVKELIGAQELFVEPDGTIPVRTGSTVTYIRLLDADPPTLQVFSPMLTGLSSSPELIARLNELNGQIRFARMFFVDDRVVVAAELPAETLDPEEIRTAMDAVSATADRFDEELAAAFGGQVHFVDEPTGGTDAQPGSSLPPPPPGDGGPAEPDGPASGYL
jgi:hypothetical protein